MTGITKTESKTPSKPERTPPTVETFHDEENALTMRVSGDVWRIFDAAGSEEMGTTLLEQILQVGSQGRTFDDKAANFIVGFIDNMHPSDPAEALLLTQMGATHQAAMMMARRLNHVKEIPQQDSAKRALNKLLRSFAAQMDTLKRYRSKGKQVVRVERVTVGEGGQAIVGNVEAGGGGVGMKKSDVDPLHAANSAPRCKAKSKRTGLPCRNPAVRGWEVCRMHGARGGSKPGKAHQNWKHGERSKEAIERRRLIAQLVKVAKENFVE